jgi:hypothetical protein
MLDQRQRVLGGMLKRLNPHGFDPETTFMDWQLVPQRITQLSIGADEECIRSAPRLRQVSG